MKTYSKRLIDEPALQILPSLAKAVGLNESIVLQQVHYWLRISKHVHDGRVWVYKTYQHWQQEFPFWSVSTIQRIVTGLEKDGLLLSRHDLNRMSIDRTKWYSIDYEALDAVPNMSSCYDEDSKLTSSEDVNLTSPITIEYQETSSSTAAAAERPNIFTIYEQHLGALTPFIADELQDIEASYPAGWFEDAVKEAAANNVYRLSYVKQILRRWKVEGRGPRKAGEEERGVIL